MSFRKNNRLSSSSPSLEPRVLLAGSTATGGNQSTAEADGRTRREREPRSNDRDSDDRESNASQERGSQTETNARNGNGSNAPTAPRSEPTAPRSEPAAPRSEPAAQLSGDLGSVAPVPPVVGPRTSALVDQGPTATDVSFSDESTLAGESGRTRIGFVSTGDSLFANIPTRESVNGRRARDARGVSVRRYVDTFQNTIDDSLLNGLDRASQEISGSPELTIAEDRFQQVENNRTARIAEQNRSVSFVNNAIDQDPDGPVTLFINLPNAEIDGGEAVAESGRAGRNFTFDQIVSGRRSVNDFQSGDTLTIPANIARESRRVLDASEDQQVETSILFNQDGSTFRDADLIEELGAPSLGDGSTITGDFDSVNPLSARDDFSGPTADTVADLHTHPTGAVAFRPFVEDLSDEVEDEFLGQDDELIDEAGGEDFVDVFTGSAGFNADVSDIEALLVSEESFNDQEDELLDSGDELIGGDGEDELLDEGDELLDEGDELLDA